MENLNLPPFYVGQKVVAIQDHSAGLFKKGQEGIVTAIEKGCKCLPYVIGFSAAKIPAEGFTQCRNCGHKFVTVLFGAIAFAPLEQTFRSITFEEVISIESPLIGIN